MFKVMHLGCCSGPGICICTIVAHLSLPSRLLSLGKQAATGSRDAASEGGDNKGLSNRYVGGSHKFQRLSNLCLLLT